jgi:hypothetical protein
MIASFRDTMGFRKALEPSNGQNDEIIPFKGKTVSSSVVQWYVSPRKFMIKGV